MKNNATTVKEYLDNLEPDRRKVISKVRSAINKAMPKGYAEEVRWGCITWEIPLTRFPNTYNKQPLCYIAIAAKKNYYTVHMLRAYGDPRERKFIEDGFKKAGKKLDMGKGCLRFNKLDDLPIDVIQASVARTTPEEYIRIYESVKRKS